jgi:RES domain-containing protein
VILFRFGNNPGRAPKEEFNGVGGLKGEGRWHVLGTPAVYAATSEPLALLEKIIHRKSPAPAAYPLYIADVPDHLLEQLSSDDLPQDWRSIYPPDSTRQLGNAWLRSLSAVGLLVPSVLITGVYGGSVKNCLINPLHPRFDQVKLSGPIVAALDPRLTP